jgi:hypothetical protein
MPATLRDSVHAVRHPRRSLLGGACGVLLALAAGVACSSTSSSGGGNLTGPDGGVDATSVTDAAGSRDVNEAGPLDASDAGPFDASEAGPSTTVTGCTGGAQTVTMTNGDVTVAYDLATGQATFSYASTPAVVGFYAGVQLATYVTSKQYTTRTCTTTGDRTVIANTAASLPEMDQIFVLGGADHFLTQVTVTGTTTQSSRWMGPVVVDSSGSVPLGNHADPRVLWVPFDNDSFVSYNAAPLAGAGGTAFEAAAFYDNTSRAGLVVGSVTHDTWKTGIYYAGTATGLTAMNVFGGANDATWTHDVVPHGMVTGTTIASPLMFVGAGPDWRDLLEEYAAANAAQAPMLAWDGGAPFGWNSWGTLKTNVTYDAAVGASDYLHGTLSPAGFEDDGVVYVNLDSYWTNFSAAQIKGFAQHVHANGQKAGIYWTPFVDWGENATSTVEGTTSTTYQQIWLRDSKGNPIAWDGGYAVDPTHPATKKRADYYIGMFKAAGYDYVKLDFLTHGALESTARYDPTVTTGIAAYNQGMAYVLSSIGGSMFVSESIAPLFPYAYGHARRISCDIGGAASTSSYELNSAAYGWWMSGRLYAFNDPDMMTFQGLTPVDNTARVLSAAISGTVFLDGDDLSSAAGQAAAAANLENARVNGVARLGKAFRPVEGNTGTSAPSAFVLVNGASSYVALFNFGIAGATVTVDLARAGLDGQKTYTVTNLESGAGSTATGSLSASLGVNGAALFELK